MAKGGERDSRRFRFDLSRLELAGVVVSTAASLFIVFLLGPLLAWCIWGATSIWVLYRVIRGYLLFKDSKPVPGMG